MLLDKYGSSLDEVTYVSVSSIVWCYLEMAFDVYLVLCVAPNFQSSCTPVCIVICTALTAHADTVCTTKSKRSTSIQWLRTYWVQAYKAMGMGVLRLYLYRYGHTKAIWVLLWAYVLRLQ